MMESVKEEVALLKLIENNEIHVDEWIARLGTILDAKDAAMSELRTHINCFMEKLGEEQKLSESFKRK